MTLGDTARIQEGERHSRRDVRPEKRLEVRGSLGLVFDDLERAYDTIPREMVMVTLWWMGASEAEVRMVESTYEMTTAKSVGGRGRIRGV